MTTEEPRRHPLNVNHGRQRRSTSSYAGIWAP